MSGSLYQFYLLAEYYAICKEYEEYEDEYEKHISENQNKFLN